MQEVGGAGERAGGTGTGERKHGSGSGIGSGARKHGSGTGSG